MNDNQIVLKAYTSGTSEARDTDLDKAQDVTFSHQYPGGMPNSMTFYVPRKVTSTWTVKGHQRIVAKNGLKICWEGEIVNIAPTVRGDTQGVNVTCAGYWATLLQNRKTMKPWADTRVDAVTWFLQEFAGHDEETFNYEQNENYIGIQPRNNNFLTGEFTALRYTAPTGQTIKRITYDWDFDENVQAWEMQVYDVTGAAAIAASVHTATGTGSDDLTLATPRQAMELRMYARGNQNATLDKHIHAEWHNLVVYTETGSINAQEILKDIAGYIPELSTDLSKIGAETLSLVPFVNDPPRTYAEAIAQAASVGDTTFTRWGFYVGMSDQFSDGKPGLVLEQVPALTDYDYAVRMDDANVTSDLSFAQDFDGIRNWIGVQYQSVSGAPVYVTPDDDAALKDTTSITNYGQRELWLTLPTTSLTNAKYQAGRYLATLKDPQWIANGTITVAGSIRGKNGPVPTSQIQPGKRIKIENWLNDLSGNGLTFLVSGTDYSDADQTCTLAIGKPDPTEFIIARLQRAMDINRLLTAG